MDTELEYLQNNCQEFLRKIEDLNEKYLFKEFNVKSIDELKELCKKYVKKLKNKNKQKIQEFRRSQREQKQQQGLGFNEIE